MLVSLLAHSSNLHSLQTHSPEPKDIPADPEEDAALVLRFTLPVAPPVGDSLEDRESL